MADSVPAPLAFFKLPEASLSGSAHSFLSNDKPGVSTRSFSAELSRATDKFKPSSARRFSETAERQHEPSRSSRRRESAERESTRVESTRKSRRTPANDDSEKSAKISTGEKEQKAASNSELVSHDTLKVQTAKSSGGSALTSTLEGLPNQIVSSQNALPSAKLSQATAVADSVANPNVNTVSEEGAAAQKQHALSANAAISAQGSTAAGGALPEIGISDSSSKHPLRPEGMIKNNGQIDVDVATDRLVARTAELSGIESRIGAQGSAIQTNSLIQSPRLAAQFALSGSVALNAMMADSNEGRTGHIAGQVMDNIERAGDMHRQTGEGITSIPGSTLNKAGSENLAPKLDGAIGQEKLLADAALLKDRDQKLLVEQAAQKAHVELVTRQDANLLEKAQIKLQGQMNQAIAAAQHGNNEPANLATNTQSTANMFHTLSGGIVTAPIATRSDSAAPMSTSNTPFTMPLLSKDADTTMASNIRWMVNEGVRNAVVSVTPSGMGPISVQLDMENEQLNVTILAAQSNTREALDSLLPRLREQLMTQGHENPRIEVSDNRSEQARSHQGQEFANSQSRNFSDSNDAQENSRNHAENGRSGTEIDDSGSDNLTQTGNSSGSESLVTQGIYDAYV